MRIFLPMLSIYACIVGCSAKSGGGIIDKQGIFGFIFGSSSPPAESAVPDSGLGMFTFVGGLALAGVFIDGFLARRVRTHLLLLALGIGLIPFVARTIEPAMTFVASIAALTASVALIVWVLRGGWLKFRAGRDLKRLVPVIAARIEKATNGGTPEERREAELQAAELQGRAKILEENVKLRRSAAG